MLDVDTITTIQSIVHFITDFVLCFFFTFILNWIVFQKRERKLKRKRCLAMVERCGNAYDKWMMKKAKAIVLGQDGVKHYRQARWKVSLYMRWQKRWLELAEKFKPNNSTAQQGKGKQNGNDRNQA